VLTKDCASAWSVGVSQAVRRVGSVVSVASVAGFGLVMLAALAFAVITFFGDNVRAYFGVAAGGCGFGSGSVTRRKHDFVSLPPTVIEASPPRTTL
jgi:hypothetical protein